MIRSSKMLRADDPRPMNSAATLLARGSFLRVLTLAAGVLVGLFLMPFLIHGLGDRAYGLWTLVMSITAYYALLDFGITRAATRFLARAITRDDVSEANDVIATALVILLGMGGIGLLASIGIALGGTWLISDPGELWSFRLVVMILGADAVLLLPTMIINALLLAHYRFDVLSCVQLAALAVRTALFVILVLGGFSIVALAVAGIGTNIVSRILLAALARRLFPWIEVKPGLFCRRQARQLLDYGRHAFVAAFADRIRSNAGIIVVAAFLDLATVTHYGIAARIAQLFAEFMVQSLGVVGPLFMRSDALGDRAKTRAILLLTTRLSVLASVMTAGIIVMLGDDFIGFWIGEDYQDAYWPLVILTVSLAAWLMQWPSVSALFATAKHEFYAYLGLAEAVASITLSTILVQFWGMVGVSLGTAVPLLISMLGVQPRYVCRILGLERTAYYSEIGRAFFLAVLYQVPLFIGLYGLNFSSFPVSFAIACIYYPISVTLLFRHALSKPDRCRLGQAVPALRWLAF